ncbi:hypothetical protein Tco_1468898, partial [Tanacetum coccineum]
EPIPNVESSSPQNTQTLRQALQEDTQLPQTSVPIPIIADEVVFKEWDDRVVRATTTAASLDATLTSGNITKTQSTAIPNVPFPQGIGAGGSPRYQEATGGSIAQTRSERVPTLYYIVQETGELGDRLKADKERVTLVTPTHSQEDQPEDQLGVFSAAKVLVDAAKIVHTYTRRRRAVSTGSGEVSTASRLFSTAEESISTAGASMPVSTAGMVQEVNKDKGKDIMRESEPEQTKTKLQQRQERAGYKAAVRLQE